MAEAPHGTAPALEGKDIANPMAMILAVAALLHYVGERPARRAGGRAASRAIYEAVLEATAAGVRTPDLGGHADHDRVHRRGDRARAHEARDLVEPRAASRWLTTRSCGGCTARRRLAVEEAGDPAPRRAAARARARAHGDAPLCRARLALARARRLPRRLLRRARPRRVEPGARPHARTSTRTWSRPRRGARRARARARGAGRRLDGRRDDARVRARASGAGRGAGADHAGAPRPAADRPGTSSRAGTRSRTGSSATAWRVSCGPTASRRSSRGFEELVAGGDPPAPRAAPPPGGGRGGARGSSRSTAFDGVVALERVSAPTLVVASRDELDPEHPYEVARIMRSTSRAPSCQRGARLVAAGLARGRSSPGRSTSSSSARIGADA